MKAALVGTRTILNSIAAEDGRNFVPWIVLATLLTTSSVLVYPWVFPDEESRAALTVAVGANPTLGIIFGPATDLLTADGFNVWRSLALGGFLAALGAIFAVTKETRGQEDLGQAELVASNPVGRGSQLMAAVVFALAGSVLVGVISGVLTVPFGGTWEASLLLGATFAATGWMFTGVAAVASQVGSDKRSASTLAVGTLGALFLLRGFAYALDAPEWTVWANPLGWMTETKPSTENDWRPLLLAVAFAAVLLGLAFLLRAHRSFGFGMLPPKQGPAQGNTRTLLGLAFRLNAGVVVTWFFVFGILGPVFGQFATTVPELLQGDIAIAGFLAAGSLTPDDFTYGFLSTVLGLIGIIASVSGVQIMLRMRSEEVSGRSEPVLAGPVSRPAYFAANLAVALAASAASLVIAGTLVAAIASQESVGARFGTVLLQAVTTIPATWAVVALAAAVVGAKPKVPIAAWAGVVASFALTFLGPTFDLWDLILGISPFWHVPNVGAADVDWSGPLWVSLAVALLALVGFVGYRRRNISAA